MAKRARARKASAKRAGTRKRSAKRTKPAARARKRSARPTKRVAAAKRTSARKSAKRPRRSAKAATPAKDVVVTVGTSHLPKLKRIAGQLRKRGMKVDSVLEGTGQITGTSSKPPATLERQLDGAATVEETPRFQLAPPGSAAE